MKFQNSRRLFIGLLAALSFSAFSVTAQAADAPKVSLKTSMGEIVLELNPEAAPITVKNFLDYVQAGQYKGVIFHRVINGFMIQSGGFDKNMVEKGKLRPPIKNESSNGLKNEPYTIAMARMSDPDSASAQFFINVNDNQGLNYPNRGGYAVFGKVIAGMDVVDRIKAVEVADHAPHQNVPVKPVIIESATLLK